MKRLTVDYLIRQQKRNNLYNQGLLHTMALHQTAGDQNDKSNTFLGFCPRIYFHDVLAGISMNIWQGILATIQTLGRDNQCQDYEREREGRATHP